VAGRWEDDAHLLAVFVTEQETAVVRFDSLGVPELATGVMAFDPIHPAYVLCTRA